MKPRVYGVVYGIIARYIPPPLQELRTWIFLSVMHMPRAQVLVVHYSSTAAYAAGVLLPDDSTAAKADEGTQGHGWCLEKR